jgi:Protein of unknown function (DUF3311)
LKTPIKTILLLCSAAPFIGMLGGMAFVNHVTPFILGLPLPLAWITIWVLLTVVTMAFVYAFDPANRTTALDDPP